MEEKNIQEQINTINSKLDIILEEIELQKKNRRESEDLKDDLMRVGKDVYETAVDELEEVHDSIQTGDILFLFKKLLRNVNNISKSLEQIESIRGFVQDFGPISRQLSIDTMNKLDEFDRKGYFDFIRELNRALDNVVTTFAVDDVKALADNSALIVRTLKNLTDPEILEKINTTLSTIKNINIDENVSMFDLMKELNSKETKRGLAMTLKILKTFSQNI